MAKKLQRNTKRPAAPSAPAAGGGGPRKKGRRRVSDQVVTDFTVQLATLTGAGIPIVRALTILHGQTRPGPFQDVLADLVEDVSAGTPLSEAMEKHDRCFNRLYSSMVRAGEKGGVIDQILTRLAVFRERSAEIRSKVVGAMIYPLVIVIVATVVVSAVIVWVIPKFQQIFDSFDVELPTPTQILLNVSSFTVSYWYIVFGLPALLVVLHAVLMQRGGRYRYRIHKLRLKIPMFGPLLLQALVAAFARTFGTLIQAGVPHLDALAIVRDTTGNDVLVEAVEDIRRTVREGEGIARPMEETGLFDDLVCSMVDVGEQTGELDGMLLKVADAYEKSVDRRIDALFKVLEPLLLIIMAIFVGFIVISLFLPLMKIMQTLGQP
jgi:type IV pilus assembly protein PilC